MNLIFDQNLISQYKSKSQIARVLTEDWVLKNSYCPSCGNNRLNRFGNNRPIADFYCKICNAEYELKSSSSYFGKKVVDGSYQKTIDRILSYNVPHFFFLKYSNIYLAENFLVIPNHFFSPEIIEKRTPLAKNARRAGWIGCNILVGNLPDTSKIFLIKQGQVVSKNEVIQKWNKTAFLKHTKIQKRSWLIEVMNCIENLPQSDFSLLEIYKFEESLKKKYPENRFIKEKIRQQLQVLRDKGYIEFLGNGKYHKL